MAEQAFPRTLALCLLAVTLPLHAQRLSQTAPKPSASSATATVDRANAALTSGDYATALKLLTALNTQLPNNAQVLYNMGLALEALQDSTPANSTTPQPSAATTAATPTTDTPTTAESCYLKATVADPLFPAAHVALGLLLARTDRPADAHSELAVAVAIPDIAPPLKARADRALARLDLNARNTQAATADLLAALAISPEGPEDVLLSAQIAEAAPDLPAAELAYRRYLALPPQKPGAPPGSGRADSNAVATAYLAHLLLARRHFAEAEALLTTTLAAHPGDPTLTSQLAAAYLASGDPAQIDLAAPLIEKLHADHPADANITRLLARVYIETHNLGQADGLYAALIADQSQSGTRIDPTLLDERGESLLRLHRPSEAEKILKLALANPAAFPTPAALGDAATHLAFAASEADDPNGALQALALRSTVLPPSPSALFLEATANDTLHQSSKAAELYRSFLDLALGDFPEQESRARQRLTVLEPKKK